MQARPFSAFLSFLQSLLAVAALAACLPAAADPCYAVTVVAGAGSRANDLDNSGQVVGALRAGEACHGEVFANGLLRDFGTLGGADSRSMAINDLGQVAGNAGSAFLCGGGMRGLGGGVGPAINGHGDVAGMLHGAQNYPEDPFALYDGVMAGFGNLGGPWGAALSITDAGRVAGHLGLDALPGEPGEPYPTTAFLHADGRMRVTGDLAPGLASRATDVNDLGQVVGIAGLDGHSRALLYEDGGLVDLNTLGDPAAGWTIVEASAINEVQQIAANACRAGICQAVRQGMVSAVPEPPLLAMLAAGLALGLARGKGGLRPPARRRRG